MLDTNKFYLWLEQYKIHLIGWSGYIFSEVVLIGVATNSFGNAYSYIVHYLLHICLFYFHAHVVLKKSFKKKTNSWLRFIAFFGTELLVYIIIRSAIHYGFHSYQQILNMQVSNFNYRDIFQFIWRGVFFCGLSSFYYLFLEYQKERIKREESDRQDFLNSIKTIRMEDELNRAKYSYLKAQINPHLLFNTLSYLYDSVRLTNEEAGEAVICLSELMRFSLENNNQDHPELSEELNQIENLKRLNEIRQDYNLFLEIDYIEEIREVRFIPLVVISLVENMIKHGNLSEKNSPGRLLIRYNEDKLSIKTENITNTKINQSGFNKGLNNISSRLKLKYGSNAQFSFTSEGQFFKVSILVDLSEEQSLNLLSF